MEGEWIPPLFGVVSRFVVAVLIILILFCITSVCIVSFLSTIEAKTFSSAPVFFCLLNSRWVGWIVSGRLLALLNIPGLDWSDCIAMMRFLGSIYACGVHNCISVFCYFHDFFKGAAWFNQRLDFSAKSDVHSI